VIKWFVFRDKVADMQWNVAEKTFPLFVRLLAFPEYRYHVLTGLTVSVGGLTESTVSGCQLLFNYCIPRLFVRRQSVLEWTASTTSAAAAAAAAATHTCVYISQDIRHRLLKLKIDFKSFI
jgi:hypothetical protein